MLLYFFRPIQSKPRRWLSLDQFINEIGGFSSPPVRYFVSLNLNLLRQNVVPNFFPVFALIRPLTKHTLVCDHAHREVINCHRVVLATHHFRSHIARSARGILRIIRVLYPCNSKISDPQVAKRIEHQILRLDVSMKDLILMQILQTQYHTCHEEL